MALPTLGPGDVAVAKSLVVRTGNMEATFKPQRGLEYTVLLIANTPKGTNLEDTDLEEIMAYHGWVRAKKEKK